MKSEKAREYISSHTWKERDTCPLGNVRAHIAEAAVDMAEEDARYRAINAFCVAACLFADNSFCYPGCICGDLVRFLKEYDGE